MTYTYTHTHTEEMLQSLEAHDAASISGGPRPSKYDLAFFSALRTMLRECLFTKHPGLKKQHIERLAPLLHPRVKKNAF
jgi:hypothetical protein